ncbi:MAG: hypothetical protein II894_00285 [Bacteroidales bacterium]|nr:hypothetical protein [Bacteroidales bacterium]
MGKTTFYPQNKATYKWIWCIKWIYYALILQLVEIFILIIPGTTHLIHPHLFEVFLFLAVSFLEMDIAYGTIVKSIAIDEINRQIVIEYKSLIFIKKEKTISFDDFEYCFNGCTKQSIRNKIIRFFIPYFQSDMRIGDKTNYIFYFRDTYGWTIEQVSEIYSCFRKIKSPKDFDETVLW